MSNSATIDRRDVAYPTSPIDGQGYVEELNNSTATAPRDMTGPRRSDGMRAEGRTVASPRHLRSAH